MPAVGLVAGGHIFTEGDLGVALNGDPVGVVDHDQVAEFLGAGQRGGLGLDALLHAAVAEDHVDEVVERAVGGGIRVVHAASAAGRHGHADCIADACAQRPGGDFNELGVAELRVAWGQRAEGAQRLNVVHLKPEPTEVEL